MTTRPVKCAICNEQMYYYSEPGHEEELYIDIEIFGDESYIHNKDFIYVHKRCLPEILSFNTKTIEIVKE